MVRFLQFVFVVYLGMIAEIALDFLHCLAHGFRAGGIHIDLPSVPLLVFSMGVFVCILVVSVVGQDKLVEFKQQRVTFIASLIASALITGYFFPSICGSP